MPGRALALLYGSRTRLPPRRHARAATEGAAEIGVVLIVAGQLHQLVHGAKALEGVLPVKQPALVLGAKVLFHVRAREGRPAEDDRVTG